MRSTFLLLPGDAGCSDQLTGARNPRAKKYPRVLANPIKIDQSEGTCIPDLGKPKDLLINLAIVFRSRSLAAPLAYFLLAVPTN